MTYGDTIAVVSLKLQMQPNFIITLGKSRLTHSTSIMSIGHLSWKIVRQTKDVGNQMSTPTQFNITLVIGNFNH